MSRVTAWRNKRTGKLTNRITLRVEFRCHLGELIDGLCSEYVRNRVEGKDDPLPESLTGDEILSTVRDQYHQWGYNATWTWYDNLWNASEYRQWACDLIVAAFPEMEETE